MTKIEQLANLKITKQFLIAELSNKVAKQRMLITFNRLYKSFANNEISFGECLGKIGIRFSTLNINAYN